MRKSLLTVIVAAIMSVSFAASANLASHMQAMAKQFEIINTTEDSAAFLAALDVLRTEAQAGSEILPGPLAKSAPDSAEVKDYKQGYVDLIAAIDATAELAKAGKMAEAKAAAEKIGEVRIANHKKFR